MGITKDERSDLDNSVFRCVIDLIQGRNYYQNSSYEKGDSNLNKVVESLEKIIAMRKS